MLFNSLAFLIFSIIVIPLFYLLQHQHRWKLLLAASCVFYMYLIPVYILVLFAVITIDYFAALQIEKATQQHKKKWLLLSLFGNLSILFFFKYFNFFLDNLNHLTTLFPFIKNRFSHLNIILPIGLSFHTFQAISYIIEVYKGNQKPEKHYGIYALYVLFFPQLVAGPIERPQNMLHQFHEKKQFNFEQFSSGLKFVLLGLFMKSFIADRLAIPVDTVFANTQAHWSGFSIIVAMTFFAIQIYCDFAGYSYMAIGIAQTMGFKLMTNFKQPFLSNNITDYWRRWHISLSTWFKDYLYNPLVLHYRNYGNWAIALSLIFTFLVSGLWHGANYTFIIWGTLHGIALCYEFLTQKIRKKAAKKYPITFKCLGKIALFLFLLFTWIFFRAANISVAKKMINTIFSFNENYFKLSTNNDIHGLPGTYLGLPLWSFLFAFSIVPLSFFIDYCIAKNKLHKLENYPIYLRWVFYYVIILAILFVGVFSTRQFIYFQF